MKSNEDQIRQIIKDYHFQLDLRQNGGAAAVQAMLKLQVLLGMEWIEGAEMKARSSGPNTFDQPKVANADAGRPNQEKGS